MLTQSISLPLLLCVTAVLGDFRPCPLLGPRFPISSHVPQSPDVQKAIADLTSELDLGVQTSNTSHGPIYPNTTSFSIVLFDTSNESDEDPFFFQYHHTAPTLNDAETGVREVDADSIYRIGGLTEVFTIWTFLAEVGDGHWNEPITQWIPELAAASQQLKFEQDPVSFVDWDDVTLGELASHMSGISRNPGVNHLASAFVEGACEETRPCSRQKFFESFIREPPVFLPSSTPIKSIAGFQILGYALESISGKPMDSMLNDKILEPLYMTHTGLSQAVNVSAGVIPANDSTSLWSLDLGDQSWASGGYSSVADLAKAGRAIMNSSILPTVQTRRWLKPVTHTSNIVNSVGLPWEIYSGISEITDPVIDVYTARGNFGLYSSYLGVVPDFNVGYAILAADSYFNADLNAYADLVSDILPALEITAQAEAKMTYCGSYGDRVSSLVNITSLSPKIPGLSVEALVHDGVDMRVAYANSMSIGPSDLDFRLYPTNLRETSTSGFRVAFRAIFQDRGAFEDSGTPTCETWRNADAKYNGTVPLDLFIFDHDSNGEVVKMQIPALQAVLEKY